MTGVSGRSVDWSDLRTLVGRRLKFKGGADCWWWSRDPRVGGVIEVGFVDVDGNWCAWREVSPRSSMWGDFESGLEMFENPAWWEVVG